MGLEKMGQGWKKWDRVGKNGTTFVAKMRWKKWDKFLSTKFSKQIGTSNNARNNFNCQF